MLKKKKWLGIVTFIMVVFAFFAEGLTIYSLEQYEKGFLNVYADEQDGYVKITLDQITRLGENASEEMITEIIASLDATASKYWTLSTGDNILFIKSITETNRYKNFTSNSYYDTSSAKDFIMKLSEGKVSHGIINLDDGRYVISGGLFSWQGNQYRICLLTYDKAVLSQNDILEAKNGIILIISVSLALFLCFVVFSTRLVDKKNEIINADNEHRVLLNRQIERLENTIQRENAYSASKHIFSLAILPEFLKKFKEKDINPVCTAIYKINDNIRREDVLERLTLLLDKTVLRFTINEQELLFLVAGYSEKRMELLLDEVDGLGDLTLKSYKIFTDYDSYEKSFLKYWEEEGYEPIKTL